VLFGALIAALLLAALRVDLIRIRYGVGEAVREQKALLEQRRKLTAQRRSLRDPQRLAPLAQRLGFTRPERVIDLPPRAGVAARNP
jgi:hypothetical protein